MKEYKIKRHRLQTVHSTNSFLRELNGGDASFDMELATTEFQTAGRGQKGNSWESEQSKNLFMCNRLSSFAYRKPLHWQ